MNINLKSNPALKITNFTKFAKDVLDEINFARNNPLSYARKIEEMIKENIIENTINKVLMFDRLPVNLREGKKAFQEAVIFLRKQQSLPNLKSSMGLKKSAEDLINIIILNDGSDNDPIFKKKMGEINIRLNKYGLAAGEINEIVDYGSFNPQLVAIGFIVCDGDFTRKERDLIFSSTSNYASVCCGITPSEYMCTVINFSELFFEKGDVIPRSIIEKYKINVKCIRKSNSVLSKNRSSLQNKSSLANFDSAIIKFSRNDIKQEISVIKPKKKYLEYECKYDEESFMNTNSELYNRSFDRKIRGPIESHKGSFKLPKEIKQSNSGLFKFSTYNHKKDEKEYLDDKDERNYNEFKEYKDHKDDKDTTNNKSNTKYNTNTSSKNVYSRSSYSKNKEEINDTFSRYEIDLDFKNIQSIPENVDSILIIEKPLDYTDIYKNIIKTVVKYKDGTKSMKISKK